MAKKALRTVFLWLVSAATFATTCYLLTQKQVADISYIYVNF